MQRSKAYDLALKKNFTGWVCMGCERTETEGEAGERGQTGAQLKRVAELISRPMSASIIECLLLILNAEDKLSKGRLGKKCMNL